MIDEAKKLNQLQGVNEVKSATSCGNTNTACPTNTECSSTCGSSTTGNGCKCDEQQCSCTPTTTDNPNGVFKKLCDIMCCNGTTCGCSSTGKCDSISTFCKEVKSFTDLVKTVIKKNGESQESESTSTPTCECTNGNCEYCKTRRFIRLVEVYTEKLKKAQCECKPEVGKIIFQMVLDPIEIILDKFTGLISGNGEPGNGQGTGGTPQGSKLKFYECKCCIDKKENCLKDTHVMYAIYSRPRVKPVADLREAEGEVNREGHHGEWNSR